MILDEILAHKRTEVAARKVARPQAELERLLADAAPTAHAPSILANALRQSEGVAVIAEIKRRSPSGGALRQVDAPADLAAIYAAHGAAALSILTDQKYFGGYDEDLVAAREAAARPVLRKDFVVDSYQLYEARWLGADAVLLIVRALSDIELSNLLEVSERLGLDALVEAHSADEVRRALDAGATLIGVNNRDLDTLVTDVTLAPSLRPLVPPECVFVAESGFSRPEQIAALRAARVDAVLVGEALLRSEAPGAALQALVDAGRGVSLAPAAAERT